jgi:hypothetical protein
MDPKYKKIFFPPVIVPNFNINNLDLNKYKMEDIAIDKNGQMVYSFSIR